MLIRPEPAARLRAVMESELRAAFDAGFWAWPNADAPSREAAREKYIAERLAVLQAEAPRCTCPPPEYAHQDHEPNCPLKALRGDREAGYPNEGSVPR